jgi:hypothetical protein
MAYALTFGILLSGHSESGCEMTVSFVDVLLSFSILF